jgi:O-glycosyl hydrolase
LPTLLGIVLLISVTTSSFFSGQPAYAASAVTINGATTYQTIDGFGFSEAFGQANGIKGLASGPQKQILDLLFSPTTGAGFTILRNLLPSDSSNTIEPNSPGNPNATPQYRWDNSSEGQIWLSQQARSYGVTQLYGDAWSAPGYMKTNGSEANGGTLCGAPGATSCSTGDWRQAYANYLVQYARDYQNAGVPLTELGAFNELNYTASYSSMLMNPTQAADFIGILGSTVRASGLNPKIVCCDVLGWNTAQSYANGIESNSAANAATTIFSSHGYGGAPTFPITGLGSRHVWETEWGIFDSPLDNNWDDGGQSDGFHWAQRIHTGMTAANLSAFFWWWAAVSNAGDNGDLISFSGNSVTVAARLWAFANYSRFIRPGAIRIGASSGDNNLQVSAYKNANGTVSIAVLNTANNAITASYSLQNTGVADGTTVTPYLTNGSNHAAQQSTTSVSGGAFSATIPARSLVTYVLTGTGGITPTPTSGTTPTPTPTTGTTPTPTPTSGSGASCKVSYTVTNQWNGGFGANIAITNTSSTAWNGWTLKFSFPGNQQVTQLWNGSVSQSGSTVTVTNASYNGQVAAGAAVSPGPGFNGSWNGSNPNPTSFTVNGATCSTS